MGHAFLKDRRVGCLCFEYKVCLRRTEAELGIEETGVVVPGEPIGGAELVAWQAQGCSGGQAHQFGVTGEGGVGLEVDAQGSNDRDAIGGEDLDRSRIHADKRHADTLVGSQRVGCGLGDPADLDRDGGGGIADVPKAQLGIEQTGVVVPGEEVAGVGQAGAGQSHQFGVTGEGGVFCQVDAQGGDDRDAIGGEDLDRTVVQAGVGFADALIGIEGEGLELGDPADLDGDGGGGIADIPKAQLGIEQTGVVVPGEEEVCGRRGIGGQPEQLRETGEGRVGDQVDAQGSDDGNPIGTLDFDRTAVQTGVGFADTLIGVEGEGFELGDTADLDGDDGGGIADIGEAQLGIEETGVVVPGEDIGVGQFGGTDPHDFRIARVGRHLLQVDPLRRNDHITVCAHHLDRSVVHIGITASHALTWQEIISIHQCAANADVNVGQVYVEARESPRVGLGRCPICITCKTCALQCNRWYLPGRLTPVLIANLHRGRRRIRQGPDSKAQYRSILQCKYHNRTQLYRELRLYLRPENIHTRPLSCPCVTNDHHSSH